MDKETLSHYGWIVILVLILSVLLALASPFGNFIVSAIKSTTAGFFSVNEGALGAAGIIIPGQSFDDEDIPAEPTRDPALNPDDGTEPSDGETYFDSVYIYTYSSAIDGWAVTLNLEKTDRAQTTYPVILESINGKLIRSLYGTFASCSQLTTPPEVPYGVTNMDQTFYSCQKLGDMSGYIIPSNVKTMEKTFYVCSSLTSGPTIPDSVENINYTFWRCSKLSAAPTLGKGIKTMNQTFYYCSELKTAPVIPYGVTSMSATFQYCDKLTETPKIPETVQNLSSTFAYCTKLTVAPQIPSGATNIGGMFMLCTSMKTYEGSTDPDGDFSDYKLPEGITSIGTTFSNCDCMIIAPYIPDSVENMNGAFGNCWQLQTVQNLPKNLKDMSLAFAGCTKLETVPAIPEGTQNMKEAFEACHYLKSISPIPSSVTNLQETFNECERLEGTIYINSVPTYYTNCFGLKNSATGKNITLDGSVPPAFLYALAQSSPAGKRIVYGTVEYRGSYIYKQ